MTLDGRPLAPRGPSAGRWKLMREVERLTGRIRGGRFRRLEPYDTTGQPVVDWFLAGHLYRKRTKVPVLFDPPLVPATQLGLDPEELALTIELQGEARLYPTSTLRVHHIVNDTVGGTRVLITFCQKCYTGAAFDPHLDGRVHLYEMFGMYQGAAVIRDRETRSLWSHATGEALVGPMAGRRLDQIPVHMTKAGGWLALHPDTMAPAPRVMVEPKPFGPGDSTLDHENLATISRFDPRLPPRGLVLGVTANGVARAYVVDPAHPGPRLVEDELGDVPLVLLADVGAWPLAYDRRTDQGEVRLRLADGVITDATGSRWTGAGVAVEGPRKGTRLPFVPSLVGEWHAWSAFHPSTDLVWLVERS